MTNDATNWAGALSVLAMLLGFVLAMWLLGGGS